MIWKTIQEYPDYEASDTGLIRSKFRIIKSTAGVGNVLRNIKISERILKPSMRNGYEFVTLRKNGKHKANMIHHIISNVFIGMRPSGLVVNHKNGVKTDNRLENLEYCSMSKNTQQYFKSIGKCNGVVPYSDLPKIINRINSGDKIIDIANQYNVSRNDIAVIGKIIQLTGEELTLK